MGKYLLDHLHDFYMFFYMEVNFLIFPVILNNASVNPNRKHDEIMK